MAIHDILAKILPEGSPDKKQITRRDRDDHSSVCAICKVFLFQLTLLEGWPHINRVD